MDWPGTDVERATRIIRFHEKAILVPAHVALVTVLTGYFRPLQRDEGALPRVFQLSILIVVLAPASWLFHPD